MIEIRDILGKVKLQVLELDGSVHRFELMKEDYILLKFSEEEPVYFDIGDYVETEEGCFYVTEPVYPVFNTSTAGYDYELKLESHYYRWKNHILFYDRQGNKEASWSLTRAPEAHLGIVVSNLRSLGFTYNGKEYQAVVDSTVSGEAKLVQYENTNIVDALTKMAEAWDCEWWVDGDKIYLGRLEYGDPVDLEIGKELYSISRSQSQDIYATRLYVFGSTRNIPSDYRQEESGTVVDGVIQKRLMLPEGTPYIDVVEGLKEEQVIEAVVVLDEVYPKFIGTISSITTVERTTGEGDDSEVFTAYQFKDDSFKFSNEYIIPGETLKLQFQTGPLAGMEFELKFNPNGLPEVNPESQVFEIVRNQDYGQWLPKEPLIPGVGNQYSLLNFDTKYVGDELIPRAEQELLEKGLALKDKMVSDPSTYNCVLNSYKASGYDENNGTLNPEKSLDLKAGQKVNLKNPAYFKNGRVTRVIGFEKKLDYPYDSPSYTIGETAAYSRLGELEQKIDNIQLEGNTYVNQGGAGVGFYLIKKDDPTAASDENVFSALRTLFEINKVKVDFNDMFLRKDVNDTAHGIILFDDKIGSSVYFDGWDGKGWKIENTGLAELDGARIRSDVFLGGKIGSPSFASGSTGWGWEIDTPTASGTVDNWTVRKSMKVYELVYSQIYGLSGSVMITDFNKIKSVGSLGTNRYRCVIDDMEGEMFMNLRNGDIVRVQKRDGWNIRYYYALVENVTSDTFDLKIIDGVDIPQEGDVCFRMGSKTDKNRQGLVYLTSSDDYSAYIDILDGIDGPSFKGKTKVRLGNLRGLTVNGQPLDMHGIYINGGIFQHSSYYLDNGNTIEQQFTIMDGKLESSIEAIRNDMSVENGNILRNSGFSTDTNYWTATNNVHFIPVGDGFLWVPSDFYVEKESVADIYRDGSRNVLRIKNCSIRQLNSVLNLPERSQEDTDPKEYSFSFFYRVLRTGTITAGFSGSELYVSQTLEPSDNYQKLSKVAQWNEQGDFELSFTGEILIYSVSLFNDALADAVLKLETRIEQTEEYIKLLATKEYVDSETNKVYKKYDAELKVTAEEISQRVTYSEYEDGLDDLSYSLSSQISVQAGKISAVSQEVDNINNRISTAGWITSSQGNQLYAKKQMENGATIISTINQTAESVSIDADKINLNGVVTANKNFQILSDGSMKAVNANLSGTITSTSGKIGGFTISSNSLYSERVTLSNDGVRMNYNGASVFINSVSPISGMTGAAIAINASSSAYAIAVKGGKIGSYRSGNSFIFAGQTVAIRVDNSDTWFNFVNGLFVGAKKVREINWNDYTNSVS